MYVVRDGEVDYRRIKSVQGLATKGDIKVKPMYGAENMVMIKMHLPPGAGSPPHTHEHESLCYVVQGRVQVVIEDETYVLEAGDVCRHPEGVVHGIQGLDDSIVLEIKSPAQPLEQFLGTGE